MADHHDHSNDDFVHGEMDIHQQQHSFDLFTSLTKWVSLHLAVVLTFVVLLTCTKTGFVGSAIAAVVVAAVGWFMLKSKPDQKH